MSRGRRGNDMANNMLGMFGMDGGGAGNVEDDADLNAELAALLSGNEPPPPTRRRKKDTGGGGGPPGPMADAGLSLEAQVALAMRDVPDDVDIDDTNDSDLLAELQEIMEEEGSSSPSVASSGHPSPAKSAPSGCSVAAVEERLDEYRMAVAMAESMGDSGKARRYQRGMRTLEEQLNKVRAGQVVADADLPPSIPASLASPSTPAAPAPPPASRAPEPVAARPPPPSPKSPKAAPEPELAPKSAEQQQLPMLTQRRDQYKAAALQAKRADDIGEAKRCVQVAKQFDTVIGAIEAGQAVDLSNIPPPPGPRPAAVESAERQRTTAPAPASSAGPASGRSLAEDLQARMEVLQKSQQKAQEEGNSSKARRMGRCVAAYKEALAACRAGRQYNYTELAVPPGFEPLPADAAPGPAPAPQASPASTVAPQAPTQPRPSPAPAPAPAAAAGGGGKGLLGDLEARMAAMVKAQEKAQQEENSSKARRLGRCVAAYKEAVSACRAGKPYPYSELAVPPGFAPLEDVSEAAAPAPAPAARQPARAAPAAAGGARPGAAATPPKLQRTLSRSTNQTLVFLQERQRQFKEAALKAKNEGKKDLALTYLRQSKGFDPMISAAENGLPVDMSKLPPLPGEKEVDFGFLKAEECDTPDDMNTDDPKELYKQLAQKLQTQIGLCRSNSDRCARMGDVATASKFDRLLRTSQLDLAALRSAESHGDAVPRFHFEWKMFTMERTNPDLGDDVLELQLIRGIDLAPPGGSTTEQLDTYLRAELPFPSSEEPQTFSTEVVRHTNSPEFKAVHKFSVNRKQRTFQRLVKSRAVKVEVFYKRGFLKADKVLGTATVKLADLETRCELHDSFDLMDGRKAVGGRVEVRVRLRDPINGRQVEETREKWLVIDAATRPASGSAEGAGTAPAAEAVESVEVMRYERDLLVSKMKNLRAQLTPAMTQTLEGKREEMERKIATQERALKGGGVAALKAYASEINKLAPRYNAEAREMLKNGDRNKASILMTKKKLVEKEVAAIRTKIGAK